MMRKQIFLLLFLFIAGNSFSECYFFKLYRYLLADDFDAGSSIISLKDGGFMVVGDSDYSPANGAAFTVRTNSCGDTIWQKAFNYSPIGAEVAKTILAQKNIFYIIGSRYDTSEGAGSGFLITIDSGGTVLHEKMINRGLNDVHSSALIENSNLILSGHYNYGPPYGGAFLAKTDSVGNVLWHRVYDTSSYYLHPTVNKTFDGGYAFSGRIYGSASSNWFLLKTDSAGNKEWEKRYIMPYLQGFGYSITTQDSGFIIVGNTETADGSNNALITKTNDAGSVVWSKEYGLPNNSEVFTRIIQLRNGDYIAGGDRSEPISNGYFLWFLRLDQQGNIKWEREYTYQGNLRENYLEDIIITPEGDIVATGYVVPRPFSFITTGNDMFIIKIDSCGYLESPDINAAFTFNADTTNTVTFSNQSTEYCTLLWYFGDGDSIYRQNPIHTYNDTGTYTVTLIVRAGNSTDTVSQEITLTPVVNSIHHPSTDNEELFQLYPNPNNGTMTLEYILESEEGEFRLFNLTGQVLVIFKLKEGTHKLTIEQQHLNSGVYLFKLIAGGVDAGNGKIVIMR